MPTKRRKLGRSAASRSNTPDPGDFEPNNDLSLMSPSSFALSSKGATSSGASAKKASEEPPQLVLTSEKRRGIYECDYCHSDISQLPRIRCAVCSDFDLCLDCFATTDHEVAMNRIKASAVAAGIAKSVGGGAASIQHEHSHGYRVCDSTRFPLFPSVKALAKSEEMSGRKSPATGFSFERQKEKISEEEQNKRSGSEPSKPSADANGLDKNGDKPKNETADSSSDSQSIVGKSDDKDGVAKRSSSDADDDKTELDEPTSIPRKPAQKRSASSTASSPDTATIWLHDDTKTTWTVEEDLRLLDAIKTCGLGNWVDIAEAISGQGSANKTPKRCMEHYFDDYLGRYGHILPSHTIVQDEATGYFGSRAMMASSPDILDPDDPKSDDGGDAAELEGANTSSSRPSTPKRRRLQQSFGRSSTGASSSVGRRKVVLAPTTSLVDMGDIWPEPYIPNIPSAKMSQEVGRDKSLRSEQAFVKAVANAPSKKEADAIRKEWEETRLNRFHGPTVLPMRIEDIPTLPGSELAGFMPRRGDFDMEWENNAEDVIADMEFSANDSPQDRQLKLQVLAIYNEKLDERERRKTFLKSRGLLDYRKKQAEEAKMPRDELHLMRRMRLFERFHTPEEHSSFMDDVLKAKRLRKQIAKLQMYRRMGIKTLAEAERYELDKSRREFHKVHQLAKQQGQPLPTETGASSSSTAGRNDAAGGIKSSAQSSASVLSPTEVNEDDSDVSNSLWKQYRTSDRKHRRSINRTRVAEAGGGGLTSTAHALGAVMDGAAGKPQTSVQTGIVDDTRTESSTMPSGGTGQDEKKPVEAPQSTEAAGKAQGDGNTRAAARDSAKEATKKEESKESESSTSASLLMRKEADLCERLGLDPGVYLKVKRSLIQESLRKGLLESTNKRTMVKIDVEKKGKVVDFMVRAGWLR